MTVRAVEKRNANLRTLNMTGDRVCLNDDGGLGIYVAKKNVDMVWLGRFTLPKA